MNDDAPTEPERLTIEAWAAAKCVAPWIFAAARSLAQWAVGAEVTEDEFDQAVSNASGIPLR